MPRESKYMWLVFHRGLSSDDSDYGFLKREFASLELISFSDLKVLSVEVPQSKNSDSPVDFPPQKGVLALQRVGGGRYRWAYVNANCELPERFETGEWDGFDPDNWRARNGPDDIKVPQKFHRELARWKKEGFRCSLPDSGRLWRHRACRNDGPRYP